MADDVAGRVSGEWQKLFLVGSGRNALGMSIVVVAGCAAGAKVSLCRVELARIGTRGRKSSAVCAQLH